jgi:hypothetical protein
MDNAFNSFNDINEIRDELERLLQEVNGIQTNNRRTNNRNRRQPDNSEMVTFLRELLISYHSNITTYQENMRFMMQILSLLINETQHNRQPNVNRRSEYDFIYYRNPNISNLHRATAMNWYGRNTVPLPNFNENVIVAPTPEQIYSATLQYNYSLESNANNTNCPITLDEFQEGEPVTKIEHCGHVFRREAIGNWFQRNVRCPVCRYDIRESSQEQSLPRPTQRTRDSTISEDDIYNSIRASITNSLSNIINEYYSSDASQNLVYTFEFPIVYNDISNNPFRHNN